MSGLLWPGGHRAAGVLDDVDLVAAMLAVETAWSHAMVEAGVFPAAAAMDVVELGALVRPADIAALAEASEAGGNPVIPLVALLRERLAADGRADAARWLHRGLTSQDVVDTALAVAAADARTRILEAVERQVVALVGLVTRHRDDVALARTLAQPAVPTVLGLRFAGWLGDVLDAEDDLRAAVLPAQFGGAAGTMAATVELLGATPHPEELAATVAGSAAAWLGLTTAPVWHTRRRALTRLGDACVAACDAWGHVANDVLVGSRPEIGELAEGAAGGSSTMPGKANPVLSVLLRRTAIAAPHLGATLHAAAADASEERTPGGWHAEWETLALLLRRTLVAADQAGDLLAGLQVDVDRAADNLAAADALAEQRSMAGLLGVAPRPTYLGTAARQIAAVLERAAGRSRL